MMANPPAVQYFDIPKNITSDKFGFAFLASISLGTYKNRNGAVLFDFSGNEWFDANLCSSLGVMLDGLKSRGNAIYLFGVNENVERVFRQNGFYKHIEPAYEKSGYSVNIVDYRKFHLQDINAFQQYITEQLLRHDDFPKMSELLSNKIAKSILEIFNNAHIHGRTKHVYTCGQYFKKTKLLKFTISDMGVTIRKNVNTFFKSGNKISGIDAIDWAVKEGNTTRTGKIPGGLGLSLIREFLNLNKGRIQIVSSDGFWEENCEQVNSVRLDDRFLGTIVTLEFNLDDTNTYILAEEINLSELF